MGWRRRSASADELPKMTPVATTATPSFKNLRRLHCFIRHPHSAAGLGAPYRIHRVYEAANKPFPFRPQDLVWPAEEGVTEQAEDPVAAPAHAGVLLHEASGHLREGPVI